MKGQQDIPFVSLFPLSFLFLSSCPLAFSSFTRTNRQFQKRSVRRWLLGRDILCDAPKKPFCSWSYPQQESSPRFGCFRGSFDDRYVILSFSPSLYKYTCTEIKSFRHIHWLFTFFAKARSSLPWARHSRAWKGCGEAYATAHFMFNGKGHFTLLQGPQIECNVFVYAWTQH